VVQKLKKLIDQKYRINLVLDNLPVTAQDLLDEVRRLRGGAARLLLGALLLF
jgi:hypothetical protein